jgi:hypothetical protein
MFSAGDAFSNALALFVIEAVGRRVLQALAVGQRDAAPAAQGDETGLAAPGGARASARTARPCDRNSSRMVSSSASSRLRTAASPRSFTTASYRSSVFSTWIG